MLFQKIRRVSKDQNDKFVQTFSLPASLLPAHLILLCPHCYPFTTTHPLKTTKINTSCVKKPVIHYCEKLTILFCNLQQHRYDRIARYYDILEAPI